jgi:hypothetical protein
MDEKLKKQVSKYLEKILKQAADYTQQAETPLQHYLNKGDLHYVKGKLLLKENHENSLFEYLTHHDKLIRRPARVIVSKLSGSLDNLANSRHLIRADYQEIKRMITVILQSIEELPKILVRELQNLEEFNASWKIYDYYRNEEKLFIEKVSSNNNSSTASIPNRVGTEGNSSMVKKVEDVKKVKKTGTDSIQSLLKQLENSDDQAEKRKIRAKLRKLGHSGGVAGLGSKKAGKKKSKVVDEDEDEE